MDPEGLLRRAAWWKISRRLRYVRIRITRLVMSAPKIECRVGGGRSYIPKRLTGPAAAAGFTFVPAMFGNGTGLLYPRAKPVA